MADNKIIRLNNPMEDSDDTVEDILRNQALDALTDAHAALKTSSVMDNQQARMEMLMATQDGIIHALISLHSLIHVEMGSKTHGA